MRNGHSSVFQWQEYSGSLTITPVLAMTSR
jgi:hypothetical protein